jgi:hypothetical protein
MVERGEVVQVRRGVYADEPFTGDHKLDHIIRARAAALLLSDNKVFSHQTAGVLHGLPVWRPRLVRVAVTRHGRSGGRRDANLILRAAPLPETDITMVDGLPVTTLARTAADLARDLPLMWALPVLDSALRLGLEREELKAQEKAVARWPGVRTFKAALRLADAAAESPGESISRVVFHRLGIPPPLLQQDIFHSETGKFLGRPDFCWPELRIVGEFDGKVKYSCGADDEKLEDIVMREKRREHELRADAWEVIRWVWAELFEPQAILEQWRVACAASARRGVS